MGVMSERALESAELSREHDNEDRPISAKVSARFTERLSQYYDPQREHKLASLRAYSDVNSKGESVPLGQNTRTRMAEYIATGLLPDPNEVEDDDSFEY